MRMTADRLHCRSDLTPFLSVYFAMFSFTWETVSRWAIWIRVAMITSSIRGERCSVRMQRARNPYRWAKVVEPDMRIQIYYTCEIWLCSLFQSQSWTSWFVKCSNCFCYCDEDSDLSDRFFSLRDVVTDVSQNRCVSWCGCTKLPVITNFVRKLQNRYRPVDNQEKPYYSAACGRKCTIAIW